MSDLAIGMLRKKRERIKDHIGDLYKKIAVQQRNLAYLDAVIDLMKSDNPDNPPPKKSYKRTVYFHRNELQRIVQDELRKATGPLGTRDIAATAIATKGLPEGVLEAVADM